jgi:hypothetical protein
LTRRALLALALVYAGSAAIAQSGQQAQPPTPKPRPTVGPATDLHCSEDDCLRQLRGLARRDGDHLHLTLTNGTTRTFTTTTDTCEAGIYEKCLQYRLIGYYARHGHFLVDVAFLNHGGVTFLVSRRNGEHISLDGVPHFSPGGTRIAAVSASESADHGANSIEIWSTATHTPQSEWRYEVPDGEYSLYKFAGWDGDDRLKMTVATRIGEEFHDAVPVEAVRTPAGWRLMPAILDVEPEVNLVTVMPEPANYAWYLRADFYPRHTSVRGIPVRQINPDWCKASELRKEEIPSNVRMTDDGKDEMEEIGLSFAVDGSFDGTGHGQVALTGIYQACNGEKGGFVMILDQGVVPKIRHLDWWPTSNPFSALKVLPDSAIKVLYCMNCDDSAILEWKLAERRFDWRPPPDERN